MSEIMNELEKATHLTTKTKSLSFKEEKNKKVVFCNAVGKESSSVSGI